MINVYWNYLLLCICYFKWIKCKNLFEKRFENKHFNDVSKVHGDY